MIVEDSSKVNATSNRVDWIDTAKGICILLVVLHHCSNILRAPYPLMRDVMTFRMPLYFILSGLFFKQYGPKVFVIKKINKLLVSYVFFYVVTGVLIPVSVYRICGYAVANYENHGFYDYGAILSLFSERIIVNPSIWFLFCLFEVNMIFYVLFVLSKLFKHRDVVLGAFSLVFGVAGLVLSIKDVDLPCFIDSSMSVLPFFYFGFLLRNHSSLLTAKNSYYTIAISSVFIFVSMSIIHFFNFGELSIISNTFGGLKGCIQAYPYGIMGTCAVLLLSKILGRVPVLSYIGRYSIIVLCTHVYVIYFMSKCFKGIINNHNMKLLVVYLASVMICLMLIPIVKKYLGVFTAQKDLIKLDNNQVK